MRQAIIDPAFYIPDNEPVCINCKDTGCMHCRPVPAHPQPEQWDIEQSLFDATW